ncbi:hypothetical protein [Pseudomonas sp. Irchel 3H3]|uniref:hypothetical protein n=1 Tax=Pseudomonas sp. Irchel 3H3 TaxID=2009038 RepID=UPI0021148580|nr:hypothetical protein [Pseudomonas sp. Irchel 3H3]
MSWNGFTEMNEALQNLILNAHALGPNPSFQAMERPHHEAPISENLARMFRTQSLTELTRDLGDEIAPPNLTFGTIEFSG